MPAQLLEVSLPADRPRHHGGHPVTGLVPRLRFGVTSRVERKIDLGEAEAGSVRGRGGNWAPHDGVGGGGHRIGGLGWSCEALTRTETETR